MNFSFGDIAVDDISVTQGTCEGVVSGEYQPVSAENTKTNATHVMLAYKNHLALTIRKSF